MFSVTLENYDEDKVFNELVRGFNEEKIPNNKLTLDEKNGIITFLSENEPSTEILRAMYHCGVVTMAWKDKEDTLVTNGNVTNGKNDNATNDAKPNNKSSTKKEETSASSKSVKTEKSDKKKKPVKTAKTSKKLPKEGDKKEHYTESPEYCSKEWFDIDKIPELKELIQNADTDTCLINSLSRWLKLTKKAEERGLRVIGSVLQEGSLSWDKLAINFDCNNVSLQIMYDRKVKVAMQPYGIAITAQKFILTVVNYYKRVHTVKTMKTKTEESSENSDSDESDKGDSKGTSEKGEKLIEESSEIVVSEKTEAITETTSKNLVPEMKCMSGIKPFEKALKNMDSKLKTDKKVLYILKVMGLFSIEKKKREVIFEICRYMVTYKMPSSFKDLIFKEMYERCFLPETTMILSTFINNYVQKFDNERKVKAFDFLNELYDVVTL